MGVFYAPDHIGFADVTAATAGAQSTWNAVGYLIGSVFAMNLLLAVFNLLPPWAKPRISHAQRTIRLTRLVAGY